jgi:hypothetical protein
MPKYLVKTALEYPPNRRVEAGEIVDDIPAKSIKWLREQDLIKLVDGTGKEVEEVVVPVSKSKAGE